MSPHHDAGFACPDQRLPKDAMNKQHAHETTRRTWSSWILVCVPEVASYGRPFYAKSGNHLVDLCERQPHEDETGKSLGQCRLRRSNEHNQLGKPACMMVTGTISWRSVSPQRALLCCTSDNPMHQKMGETSKLLPDRRPSVIGWTECSRAQGIAIG